MALSYVAGGGAANGTTSITPATPAGITANDLLVCLLGNKPFGSIPSVPSGWTQQVTGTNGSTANATDAGSTRATIQTKLSPGTTDTAVARSVTSGSPAMGQTIAIRSSTGEFESFTSTFGGDTNTAANLTVTGAANLNLTTGDYVVTVSAIPTDNGDAAGFSLTVPGCTVALVATGRGGAVAGGTTSGNDGAMQVNVFEITGGTSTGAPTYSHTNTAGSQSTGTVAFLRVRERVPLTGYGGEVMADNPVGYWKLDETTGTLGADSSGNGRDGTYSATGVTLAQPTLVVGEPGSVDFNGTSGRLAIPTTGLGAFTNFTIEAWIKPDPAENGSATDRWIYRYGIFLRMRGSGGGQLRGGYFGSGGERQAIESNGAALDFFDGDAHHVAVTYDGATIRLYADGVARATLTQAAETISYSSSPAVGSNAQFGDGWFNGVIDEVAVYTTVLSGTRIAEHYAAGAPPSVTYKPWVGPGTGKLWVGPGTRPGIT